MLTADDLDRDVVNLAELVSTIAPYVKRELAVERDVLERLRKRVQSDRTTHRVVVIDALGA